MEWKIIIVIDTILKAFQYGWFIIVPLLVAIIMLAIKIRAKKSKKNVIIISSLSLITLVLIVTSRLWGPTLYAVIIAGNIGNKEDVIEEKLEKKYNRDFTFVSKEGVESTSDDPGNILGQDINNDYAVTYKYKDEDGVVAVVDYKKNIAYDYYEIKRIRYDLEKSVYDYAEKNGIKEEFYVCCFSSSESIEYSDLNKPVENKIKFEDRIHLFMKTPINGSKEFMNKALKDNKTLGENTYVHEYVVTEDEYKNIKEYYESKKVKEGIEGEDFEGEYKVSESAKIQFEHYFLD